MLYTYGRWKIPLATLTQLGRMRLSTPPSVSRRSQCIKVPGDSTVLGSISRVWCYGIISSLQTREVPSWSPSIPEANRSRALEGSTQAAQHEPSTLVYAFWLPQLKYATRSEVCVFNIKILLHVETLDSYVSSAILSYISYLITRSGTNHRAHIYIQSRTVFRYCVCCADHESVGNWQVRECGWGLA